MKSFAYQAPTSLAEAVALLAGKEGKARPLAGGTDLLVQLRLNRFELDLVVDVKKIPELNSLVFDPTQGLTVGAAVSCACLGENRDILRYYPGLVDAASIIGGTAIQGRATLGGNLCNAAPSGDTIAAMIILGATCTIAGPQGYRTMPDGPVWPTLSFGTQAVRTTPVEAFCVAPGRTILEPGEVLVSIHFPLPEANSGARYVRFTPRQEMDIAVAAVAASTAQIAEEALRLIEVDYEVLPPVLEVRAAMKAEAPLLHETLLTQSLAGTGSTPSNIASHFQHLKGDPTKGFAEAEVIVEREFRTAPVHQSYLEPHAATAFWNADGTLTVYTTTQGAFAVRDQLAELLDYPMAKIRVIPTEVGGGFGGKGSSYVDVVAALLAREVQRQSGKAGQPVKVVMSRAEVILATGPTSGTAIRVKVGATRTGRLTAVEAELSRQEEVTSFWPPFSQMDLEDHG